MEQNGHDFLISAKDKDVTLALLERYKVNYYNRGKAANSLLGKVLNVFKTDIRLLGRVRKFAPDLIISFSSPVAAHLAFLLRKPCIVIEDTECANLVHLSYLHFSQVVLTPSCFWKNFGKKQIPFNGYKELAYLHPNQFRVQSDIHALLGINRSERFALVRIVSGNALHDYGQRRISEDFKIKLIERLAPHLKVFISSEAKLSKQLELYRISIPSWEMHAVISGASLLIGESATMAAEAAVLGVPSIFIDSQGRGYTRELENDYNLAYNFKQTPTDLERALDKAEELIQMTNSREIFQERSKKMLEDKIDVASFMVWFIENYPKSIKIMQENPDYQYNFK